MLYENVKGLFLLYLHLLNLRYLNQFNNSQQDFNLLLQSQLLNCILMAKEHFHPFFFHQNLHFLYFNQLVLVDLKLLLCNLSFSFPNGVLEILVLLFLDDSKHFRNYLQGNECLLWFDTLVFHNLICLKIHHFQLPFRQRFTSFGSNSA